MRRPDRQAGPCYPRQLRHPQASQGQSLARPPPALGLSLHPNLRVLAQCGEFERAILQERIHAGIARARKNGTKSGKPIGRARTSRKVEDAIRASLASGKGIQKTAREYGVGTGTVQRIRREMSAETAGPS